LRPPDIETGQHSQKNEQGNSGMLKNPETLRISRLTDGHGTGTRAEHPRLLT
jgi:hypothetical protein